MFQKIIAWLNAEKDKMLKEKGGQAGVGALILSLCIAAIIGIISILIFVNVNNAVPKALMSSAAQSMIGLIDMLLVAGLLVGILVGIAALMYSFGGRR